MRATMDERKCLIDLRAKSRSFIKIGKEQKKNIKIYDIKISLAK